MWDEFTWKVKVLLSRVNYRATIVVGAVILYFGVPYLAPLVMGPRGDLLGLACEWLTSLWLGAVFGLIAWIFFAKVTSPLRWLLLPGVLVFGGIGLFSAWQVFRSGADLVLPLKDREVIVARTYYERAQTGRGAMPESGGRHIVTTGGDDYTLRPSDDQARLAPGSYRLRLSHFKNVVMSVEPLP